MPQSEVACPLPNLPPMRVLRTRKRIVWKETVQGTGCLVTAPVEQRGVWSYFYSFFQQDFETVTVAAWLAF